MKTDDDGSVRPGTPVHRVRIDELTPADSPRLGGIDKSHVRRLAAVFSSLPPVLVHRPTMRVVDGMHRIRAAGLKGLDTVEVRYFEGTEDQVFLRSVAANIANGLPLSVADRKTAAARILASDPSLSDRAVAAHVGLDAKTVAGVRVCSAAGSPPLNTRTGADGRAHPLDRTAERMHAAELLAQDPALPLRTVVEKTGLSLGTAHDVRRRLLRGEDPVPQNRQAGAPATKRTAGPQAEPGDAERAAQAAYRVQPPPGAGSPRSRPPLDTLRRLANDPSLRHSDTGREFIRWLHAHFIVDEAWRKRLEAVPPHSVDAVADLARHCSDTWQRFADELAVRRHANLTAKLPELHATQPTRR
ncbi:ParB/RepB/Spo0J family partition protein [Streptomyces bambusae]|uniref:ParB/RepB/Spo0J family partition protein n=1 Tax=Streptomyces bambusae TaxID=1550616 RepID=UPI001CFD81B5|nr:ParB/RepB/Spo0J family partition protein [Streptomyces bambusae]MCB5165629.1 ParB/RepB/Spo0J family partition protein [Streptomyces bambusae]